ncbi:MAG: ribonuclease Y [Planctomycetota bacterium]|nr:MAG: ribonuclease Y [Planctomycetota bacterium]
MARMDWSSFLLGAVTCLLAVLALYQWRLPSLRRQILDEAREDLERNAKVAAKEQLLHERERLEETYAATRKELKELEDRCRLREDALDRRVESFEDRERELASKEAALKVARAGLETREAEVERTRQRQLRELERISGMRREEAEHLLLDRMEQSFQREAAEVLARAEEELQADLERRARDALLTSMQRLATARPGEALVSVVPLADDELKGLLVGREGRNARAFEAATGVDLLLDDTPGLVVLSAFEPVRREVARRALLRLLEDGRIDPARIGSVVEETRQDMEEVVDQLGAEAAEEASVAGLHPRLVALLGRLEFRTSEGVNVRRHAVETARLAAALADELGLDAELARRAGLLHNVGKAIDHSAGGHAAAGAEFAARCGEGPEVVNAIAAHHGDAQPTSPYAPLVALAATLCARRPGASDPRAEHAVRRREELEAIACRHPGVQRCYALQAGRELRVVVDPARVSEKNTARLARDIARAIAEEVPAPAPVRVSVLREQRVEELAEAD